MGAFQLSVLCSCVIEHCIEPKMILRKNQNGFRRNRTTTTQIFTICRILEGVRAKKPRGNNVICRLRQRLWLRTQREMEQILLASKKHTLNGSSLKLIDKFTYQGSSVSSTETDINTRLAKARTAIDWLSIIWKSDLTDKIKRSFFSSCGCIDTDEWMHYIDAN